MKYILILALSLTPALAWDNRQYENQVYKHEGISGQKYKYNLRDPSDEINYSIDLDAQMMDKINPNPLINLDRGLGDYGGGAKW